MAEQVTLKIPKIHWGSVLEFAIDALIVIMAGNFAAKVFMTPGTPITEQFTSFLMTLAVVAVAVKYCLSTRIVKARG